ncbi:MAG TPA: Wzz/FepE/Etk N-terminal domain-containing protein, partial [Longimicrobiales bacterium]
MSNPLEARRPDGPNPFIPPPQAGVAPDLSLGGAVDVVRRHSRLLLWLPLLALVAAVALSMMRPRTYTASTSFTLQATDGQRSALAGAAAQFGISLASGQNSESPAFYAALLTSHELLGELADSSFTVPVDGRLRRASLADLYEIEAPSAAARREAAIQLLQGGIAVSTSRETSIVSLSVTTRWAALSQELAARALA